MPEPVAAVFKAVVAWLQEPKETTRRAVETAGRHVRITTTYGQLALAAVYSEGSMSLPGQPEVLPDPWLTAKHASSVVLAASKMKKPLKIAASQRAFLVLAAELTKGELSWTLPEEEKLATATA